MIQQSTSYFSPKPSHKTTTQLTSEFNMRKEWSPFFARHRNRRITARPSSAPNPSSVHRQNQSISHSSVLYSVLVLALRRDSTTDRTLVPIGMHALSKSERETFRCLWLPSNL